LANLAIILMIWGAVFYRKNTTEESTD